MKWIGLTGSIGAGKSTVADLLRRSGFPVIDADSIAHESLMLGTITYDQVVDHFGKEILGLDLQIDRRVLGKKIFSSPENRAWLENLIHPIVQNKVKEFRHQFEFEGHKLAFYELPLLFEKGLEPQFDNIVVVSAPLSIQIQRLQSRNLWSAKEIENRINSQWPIEEKIKRADFNIKNDGTLSELESKVIKLINDLSNQ